MLNEICRLISEMKGQPARERVEAFNTIQQQLRELVADVAPDPACTPELVPVERVKANNYNPNSVAEPEMHLLEQSMRADGITMAVVVFPDGEERIVIDGFHRRTVAAERLKRRYLPCAVIDRPLADRMASTVRHNRARGKHGVELMGALVREMLRLGWDDLRIAAALGMSEEELLRLKQVVGVARLLAAPEYGRAWSGREGAAQ